MHFEDEGDLTGEDGAFKDTLIDPPIRVRAEKPHAKIRDARAPTMTIEMVRVGRPLKVSWRTVLCFVFF